MKCGLCLKAEATKVYAEMNHRGKPELEKVRDFPVCASCDKRIEILLTEDAKHAGTRQIRSGLERGA